MKESNAFPSKKQTQKILELSKKIISKEIKEIALFFYHTLKLINNINTDDTKKIELTKLAARTFQKMISKVAPQTASDQEIIDILAKFDELTEEVRVDSIGGMLLYASVCNFYHLQKTDEKTKPFKGARSAARKFIKSCAKLDNNYRKIVDDPVEHYDFTNAQCKKITNKLNDLINIPFSDKAERINFLENFVMKNMIVLEKFVDAKAKFAFYIFGGTVLSVQITKMNGLKKLGKEEEMLNLHKKWYKELKLKAKSGEIEIDYDFIHKVGKSIDKPNGNENKRKPPLLMLEDIEKTNNNKIEESNNDKKKLKK